jgi:polysaccharide biosynthesis acetyltransferase WcbI-like protein
VAGAMSQTVKQWARQPNGAEYQQLVAFAGEADVMIGLDKDEVVQGLQLKPGVVKVTIPAFGFKGLHPDSFHLEGTTSVLGAGNVFSKIIVACYLLGKSIDETAAAFREDVYARLGYLDLYDADKQRVIEKFRQRQIELDDAFARWESQGRFLYTYNHPMKIVIFDILRRALQGRFMTADDVQRTAGKLAEVEDMLAPSIMWPIYPEIGRRLNIREPLVWRKGKLNNYEVLDLRQFISLTFKRLKELRELQPSDIPGFEVCSEVLS